MAQGSLHKHLLIAQQAPSTGAMPCNAILPAQIQAQALGLHQTGDAVHSQSRRPPPSPRQGSWR